MKKLALVLLAGMSIATAANAQFQFGVKAGANFSSVSGSAISDANTVAGFNGGVYFKLPLVGHWSIQPELLYSGQGFQDNSGGFTSTQHFNYFNVPVLLKYSHFFRSVRGDRSPGGCPDERECKRWWRQL